MHLTKNYSTDGGDRMVIGGVLEFEQGAEVKNFPDGGGGTGGKAENQNASTATAVAGLKNDFNALLVRLKEAGPGYREAGHHPWPSDPHLHLHADHVCR